MIFSKGSKHLEVDHPSTFLHNPLAPKMVDCLICMFACHFFSIYHICSLPFSMVLFFGSSFWKCYVLYTIDIPRSVDKVCVLRIVSSLFYRVELHLISSLVSFLVYTEGCSPPLWRLSFRFREVLVQARVRLSNAREKSVKKEVHCPSVLRVLLLHVFVEQPPKARSWSTEAIVATNGNILHLLFTVFVLPN